MILIHALPIFGYYHELFLVISGYPCNTSLVHAFLIFVWYHELFRVVFQNPRYTSFSF